MTAQLIVINGKSSGRYSIKNVHGRKHLVTEMLPIEGDSVMNRLFYPQSVVVDALPQLDNMMVPDGHPEIDGRQVSILEPIATNIYNFGAFSRNPKLDGKRVRTDLVVDLEVAERTERGRQIVNRLRSNRRMGVSTGLYAEVAPVANKKNYDGKVTSIQFDHIAVLMDEEPAGQNTYTLNTKQKRHVMADYDEVVYDLRALAVEDRVLLSSMKVNEILAAVKGEPSMEDARRVITNAGLQVNQVSEADIQEYQANQEAFQAFKEKQEADRQEKVTFITNNSDMKAEQLDGMPEDALDALVKTVTPRNRRVMPTGGPGGLVLIDENELAKEVANG